MSNVSVGVVSAMLARPRSEDSIVSVTSREGHEGEGIEH